MADQDVRRRQALGPGHGDEVLLQGGDHVRPQQPVIDGHGSNGQGDRWQKHGLEVGAETLGQGVEAGGREDVDLHGEEEDEDDGHHEGGDGQHPVGRGGGDPVEEPVRPEGGDQRERDGDDEGQLQVDGEGHANGVRDRLMGEEGDTQIPPEDIGDPGPVLDR